ncbi:MAG: proton-conducting transporter membrane subunit [Candidatus Eiseniibacteriota bacterium]
MILAILVLLPALAGLALWPQRRLDTHLIGLIAVSSLHLVGVGLLWAGLGGGAFGSVLRLDPTGLIFLSITSLLLFLTSLYTVPYLRYGTHDPQAAPHRFVPCLLWFLSSLTLVAATQQLALLWVAVEATTLATAPLVYFYRRRGALEATWKYLLLCSVGIALALLGTFFLGISGSAVSPTPGLSLPSLIHAAPQLSHPWLKAAFILALVGYGTKMGLAPLHAWLPDTHSQAPSPVSALLSGALLNGALLALLRFYQVALASGNGDFARTLLLVLGFVSLIVACAFLVGQRDYKRLLAYSSIENMGIIAVGIALGGGGAFGALFHALNHSLSKAGLFYCAGNVLRRYGSTNVADVRGILRRQPATGVLLILLFLAIGGMPPFGAFWSKLLIFQAAAHQSVGLATFFLALVAIAFLGMAGVLLPMLQGNPDPTRLPSRDHRLSLVPPMMALAGVLLLGLYLPPALAATLRHAAALLGDK